MKKTRIRTALLLAVFLVPAGLCPLQAYSPAGYPGGAWGGASRGFDGLEGYGSQGWVRQGVKWHKGAKWDFSTYADYSWRVRTKNKTYYNAYGPGLKAVVQAGPFDLGMDFSWQRYPELPETIQGSSLFGSWYYKIEASKWTGMPSVGTYSPRALPLSTWGRLSYDLHGAEGSGSQGWVKQGVDWFSLGRGWVFNTYASYNWRLRTRNRTYYDVLGPSLGLNVSRGGLNLGMEYLWQRFPQLHTSTKTSNLYLNWYYTWDLKKK